VAVLRVCGWIVIRGPAQEAEGLASCPADEWATMRRGGRVIVTRTAKEKRQHKKAGENPVITPKIG